MTQNATNAATGMPDPLFASNFFAKVPAEVLGPLAHTGPAAMSHAEFRVFVALCRFRGPTRIVNPTRARLEMMTGLTPNNVSRATKGLFEKGWLTIHYAGANKARKVTNYELHLSTDKRRSGRDDVTAKTERASREICREATRPTTLRKPMDDVPSQSAVLTATTEFYTRPPAIVMPLEPDEPEVCCLSDAELDELFAAKLKGEF